MLSDRRKSSLWDLFRRNRFLLFAALMARETCKETLLRKASEPSAHVAGFGTRVGGLRPSDTTYGVYRQAKVMADTEEVSAITFMLGRKEKRFTEQEIVKPVGRGQYVLARSLCNAARTGLHIRIVDLYCLTNGVQFKAVCETEFFCFILWTVKCWLLRIFHSRHRFG